MDNFDILLLHKTSYCSKNCKPQGKDHITANKRKKIVSTFPIT